MRPDRRRLVPLALCAALSLASAAASAADRFFAYNETTSTDLTGVYLAPAGTQQWGPNQALNDKDKRLDTSERLPLTGLRPGTYDVKLVDGKGRVCLKRDVDLTRDKSFEIRDADLGSCR